MSAGTVESGASTIQRLSVSSPCSATSRREQRVVLEAAPEAGGADDLLGAVRARPRRGTGPRRRRARAARPTRVRAGTTAPRSPRAARRRSPGASGVEARRGRASRRAAGDVQRPAHRLAPPDGDRPRRPRRARSATRSRPPCPRRRPPRGARSRAARTRGRPAGRRRARPAARARDGPGASRTCAEGAVAVELEAAVDGAHALDSRRAEALVPAGAARAARRRGARNSATVGR